MTLAAKTSGARVPDEVQRERAPGINLMRAFLIARASGAPLIRDRQDQVCGGPASAAQRGPTACLIARASAALRCARDTRYGKWCLAT